MIWRKWLTIIIMIFALILPVHILNRSDRGCADYTSPFMRANSERFCSAGESVYLYGASFYPYWENDGTIYRSKGWLTPDFKRYIDTILDTAQAAGLNTLRPTDYLNDANFWDDPIVWENMDYLVSQTQKQGMWLILDLSTFRHWLSNHDLANVYEAQAWIPFIRFVAGRYHDAPSIAHYSILGEIPDRDETGASTSEYLHFYRQLLVELHTSDGGNHLISLGGLSFLDYDSGIPWEALYDLPHNDLAAIHIYSRGDKEITLPKVFIWARNKRKPFFIEEFGFRQEIDDQQRALAYQSMFDSARMYDAGGILFWNLGPELAADSYDVGPQTPRVWYTIQQNAP